MTAGFTFSETMAGPFGLGETDPERGSAAQTKLTMHATIDIDDIDRFITDPAHLGKLSGRVNFGPLGDDLRAESGVFNLFSPSETPTMKLMVYELQLKSYYLAGEKHVRDDPGVDLWKDTTTLFTRLYEGPDKRGPVVGAGILTLGVADLARMVSTMRVQGQPHEAAGVLARFGRFFLGELWDSYARLARP